MGKLRVLFTIQGDGRGHLTQALAVQRILLDAGHSITSMIVGRQPDCEMPAFFEQKAVAPITRVDSPAFVFDQSNRRICRLASLFNNLRKLGRFREGMRVIRDEIARQEPDVVLNFFEPLVGLSYLLYRPKAPLACVANQYLMLHPDYPFPPGRLLDRWLVRLWARVTALRSQKLLALSLKSLPNVAEHLVVIPPLLRPEVLKLTHATREPFLLIYLLRAGFREEILAWHRRHPEVRLHCFTDHPQESEAVAYDETLTFHRINDRVFLELLGKCDGVAATGGYQTISEAMYSGKPILIVPAGNHYEQQCNAHEGEQLGAGLGASRFDLDRFVEMLPNYQANPLWFRQWVAEAPRRVIETLEATANGKRLPLPRSAAA
jgi:uncharacterized protein (TIGR00661 family)